MIIYIRKIGLKKALHGNDFGFSKAQLKMAEIFRTLERTEGAALRVVKRKDGAHGPRANLVDHEIPMPIMTCSDSGTDHGLMFLTSLTSVATSPIVPVHVSAGAILSIIGMYRDDSKGILSNITSKSGVKHTMYDVGDFDERVPVLVRKQERDDATMDLLSMALNDRKFYDGTGFRGGRKLEICNDTIHTGPTALAARIRALIVQIFILLIKSVTNPEGAKPSEDRRMTQFTSSGDVEEQYLLETREAKALQRVISNHLGLRKSLTGFVQMASELGESGGRIPQIVAKLSHYIKGTGLAGYNMVKRWGIATRLPALADRGLRADLMRYHQLMKMELKMGDDFQYLALNDNPHSGSFAPGCFTLLWSYSIGVATVLDKQASNLTVNKELLNTRFYQLGKRAASASNRGLDTEIANALGLDEKEANRTRAIMAGKVSCREGTSSESETTDDEGDPWPSSNTQAEAAPQEGPSKRSAARGEPSIAELEKAAKEASGKTEAKDTAAPAGSDPADNKAGEPDADRINDFA
ncbi:nucleocapsid protein [Hippocampus erectus paramyxovirus 1]|nr:nucleocapsid protein [Hippocampus erectus paramyxovirus 1]